MLKLCFYVPEANLEAVKIAVFAAGAGRVGDYEQCCWQCKGEGQFRPLADAQPYIGEADGALERVVEYKVEMVCEEAKISAIVNALTKAHPYEEVAYDVVRLEPL